ncbi:hypothetical protein TcCL_Unassigned02399, partial [Trypanosoma cruzi]
TSQEHMKHAQLVTPLPHRRPLRGIPRSHRRTPPEHVRQTRLVTPTAAPRSSTPPPLFCFLLRVRLLLRWRSCESECERAVHRPHTHSSFSVCVSPCMDSRPHLTPRSTHNNVPIVYMHARPCRPVGALFCTTRTAAVLPGCMDGAP